MDRVKKLEKVLKTGISSPEKLLEKSIDHFGDKIILSSSFGAEDQVLLDMICKFTDEPEVFTLDTGRLPQETYDLIEKTRDKYAIDIQVIFPDWREVETMVEIHGPNLFYKSVELRKLCCRIRKIKPLKRKLSHYEAWICGLRSEQSITRSDIKKIQQDYNFDVVKISPLADWNTHQVWEYIRKNHVPYNALHDKGYPSIGCACCTRAVCEGEDIRAGRWWWEQPVHKECGLHLSK